MLTLEITKQSFYQIPLEAKIQIHSIQCTLYINKLWAGLNIGIPVIRQVFFGIYMSGFTGHFGLNFEPGKYLGRDTRAIIEHANILIYGTENRGYFFECSPQNYKNVNSKELSFFEVTEWQSSLFLDSNLAISHFKKSFP